MADAFHVSYRIFGRVKKTLSCQVRQGPQGRITEMRSGDGDTCEGFRAFLSGAAVLFCLLSFIPFADAQGSEKNLTERIERLEKVIQDYKQMMQHYEQELNTLKGEQLKNEDNFTTRFLYDF
jgi:hypothetical protein